MCSAPAAGEYWNDKKNEEDIILGESSLLNYQSIASSITKTTRIRNLNNSRWSWCDHNRPTPKKLSQKYVVSQQFSTLKAYPVMEKSEDGNLTLPSLVGFNIHMTYDRSFCSLFFQAVSHTGTRSDTNVNDRWHLTVDETWLIESMAWCQKFSPLSRGGSVICLGRLLRHHRMLREVGSLSGMLRANQKHKKIIIDR